MRTKVRKSGWEQCAVRTVGAVVTFLITAGLASCTPMQRVQYRPSAQAVSTAQLRAAIGGIFAAYEREDIATFMSLVSRDFRSSDNGGHSYTTPYFENAVREDFSNLSHVSFDVFVNAVTHYSGQSLCRTPITWFRRTRVPFGNEEWIVRGRSSALVWRREDEEWRLYGIEEEAVFGLSSPSGVILVREGEVNGAPPAAGARIENGDYR